MLKPERLLGPILFESEFSIPSTEIRIIMKLKQEYSLSEEDARYMFEQSYLPYLIKDNPDYVDHYSDEYWATEIYEKHNQEN